MAMFPAEVNAVLGDIGRGTACYVSREGPRNRCGDGDESNNRRKQSFCMWLLKLFVPSFDCLPLVYGYASHEEVEYFMRAGAQGALYFPAGPPSLSSSRGFAHDQPANQPCPKKLAGTTSTLQKTEISKTDSSTPGSCAAIKAAKNGRLEYLLRDSARVEL